MELPFPSPDDVASKAIEQKATENQYNLSPIPAHTHNGTDSIQVSFSNLSDRLLMFSYTVDGTLAATSGNYGCFFIAPYPLTILGLKEVHAVKATVGSPTVTVEKLTSGIAPGSGTVLLTTAFDLSATINVVQTGTLVNPLSSKNLAINDRLALKTSGTLTSVSDVTVSVLATF